MVDDDRLAAACARLAREKGWTEEERDRLVDMLADGGRRRALSDHPRRLEFLGRALAEMLGGRGATGRSTAAGPDEVEVRVFMGRALVEVLGGGGAPGRTVASDPDEVEVRVVALMMAEGLAPRL